MTAKVEHLEALEHIPSFVANRLRNELDTKSKARTRRFSQRDIASSLWALMRKWLEVNPVGTTAPVAVALKETADVLPVSYRGGESDWLRAVYDGKELRATLSRGWARHTTRGRGTRGVVYKIDAMPAEGSADGGPVPSNGARRVASW
jgi:hypothetical protein